MSVKKLFAALFAAAFIIMTALPVFALPTDTPEYEPEPTEDNSGFQDSSNAEEASWQDGSTVQNSYEEYSYEQQESYEDNSYTEYSYNYDNDNDYSYTEESYYQEYSYYLEDSYSYYYEQDTEEKSYYENEESISDEYDEEYQESYEESYEESLEESSEQDSSESEEESSGLSVTDPFGKLSAMNYILPSDDPNYIAKQKKEDSNAAAGSIRHNSGLLDSPPMPSDTSASALSYTEDEDDSSFLMGIIFWSVIGIVLTILLIFIINLKGSGNSNSFGRKRYHKNTYKPSRRSHSSYTNLH